MDSSTVVTLWESQRLGVNGTALDAQRPAKNMTRTLYLSNKVKATLSLAGSENIMTIIVPEIRRRFAGKKAFTSPWVESSIEPIHGTFKYLHTAQLTGESDATVETNDNQISIEFKLVDGGPGLEDTVIAIYTNHAYDSSSKSLNNRSAREMGLFLVVQESGSDAVFHEDAPTIVR
ncbi:hypothetical protein RHS01_04374 [Rhizoctonia solani]|uniref:Uncharacterized protein n=1 Tax=Rhizoctonia solani TaxID=456999 RepID=A0A8H7IFL5_9AGAM|nr:hypothetical protein RHS01_04374 [Rhizoctonia solani]